MGYNLPEELESLRAFLPELVAIVRARAPYASALVTQSGGVSVVKSASVERVNPVMPDPGIRITAWDGATFHSAATNRLADRDGLVRLARDLAESVAPRPGPLPDPGSPLDRHFAEVGAVDPAGVPTADKTALCARIHAAIAAADSRIASAQVGYADQREYRLFCNGPRLLSSEVVRTQVFALAFGSDGAKQVSNFDFRVGNGWEATARADDDWTANVARVTLEHLAAERIPPGEYTCVLDPDCAGTLAHESFGHGCEMDTLMRGAARALEYVGRRVGSDLVDITDFPGRRGTNGTLFFSDDGVLADEPVALVRAGILQPTLMCDRYSYLMMKDRLPGLKQSASGRLESWNHPVYARMTTTFFEPRPRERGGLTRDEIIASTPDGVLLERLTSGMEDPLGWGVQLQLMRGREIRSGQLTGRLYYQVGATGYVPDVLASVDAVGSDIDLDSAGHCGKGHKEVVRVATGGPFIRCRMRLG